MLIRSHETQFEQSYEQKTKNGVGVFKLLAATVPIWLQISNTIADDTFILGLIYRHPKGNEKNFISALSDKLVELNNIAHKYYIIGNFNTDVNTNDISNNSALFLNMLNSNGVYPLIDKPTRVTGSSSTTQDHILTKDNSNIIYPCIFLSEN